MSPSDYQVKCYWRSTFTGARRVRTAAEELLGIYNPFGGPVRQWATREDVSVDAEACAKRLLDVAGSGNTVTKHRSKFSKPDRKQHLLGGTYQGSVWRMLLLHDYEVEEFLEVYATGNNVDVALNAVVATPHQTLHYAALRWSEALPSSVVPVQVEFSGSHSMVCLAGDEALVTGTYQVASVAGEPDNLRYLGSRQVRTPYGETARHYRGLKVTLAAA